MGKIKQNWAPPPFCHIKGTPLTKNFFGDPGSEIESLANTFRKCFSQPETPEKPVESCFWKVFGGVGACFAWFSAAKPGFSPILAQKPCLRGRSGRTSGGKCSDVRRPPREAEVARNAQFPALFSVLVGFFFNSLIRPRSHQFVLAGTGMHLRCRRGPGP